MEIEVAETDLRAGDRIVEYHDGQRWYEVVTQSPSLWTVDSVDPLYGARSVTGDWIHCFTPGRPYRFSVRRKAELHLSHPVVNGTFTIPPSRKVPDWPHPCPKCRRAESAVLLFQSWDCRHGCFK